MAVSAAMAFLFTVVSSALARFFAYSALMLTTFKVSSKFPAEAIVNWNLATNCVPVDYLAVLFGRMERPVSRKNLA